MIFYIILFILSSPSVIQFQKFLQIEILWFINSNKNSSIRSISYSKSICCFLWFFSLSPRRKKDWNEKLIFLPTTTTIHLHTFKYVLRISMLYHPARFYNKMEIQLDHNLLPFYINSPNSVASSTSFLFGIFASTQTHMH